MHFIIIIIAILLLLYVALRLYLKLTTCVFVSSTKLNGKTVVITGADKGIGYETALDLARRNARVIMACRDLVNAEKSANKIKSETGNDQVFVRKIDLSSLASVKEFASKFLEEEQRLDILINNAGMPSDTFTPYKTSDGFEICFVTNYLGHFLLTQLLLDKVKKCAPSRIINVSSLAHKMIKSLDLTDLNCEKSKTTFSTYGRSKALQILFTRELARQLEGTGVTVNCLHPGTIGSNFFNKSPEPIHSVLKLCYMLKLLRTSKDGAQTTLYLAVDESLEKVSGQYFSDCHISTSSTLTQDDDLAKKVFEISENYVRERT